MSTNYSSQAVSINFFNIRNRNNTKHKDTKPTKQIGCCLLIDIKNKRAIELSNQLTIIWAARK